MDGSEDSGYTNGDEEGGIFRIIVDDFGRVKCGDFEGHRIIELVGGYTNSVTLPGRR
jgi:hypothetical protein